MGGVLAGGLLGIAAGDHLLRPVALDRGEGLLVNAGHLAGAALALGATYLIVDDFEDREVLYLSTSTAGSLLGAGLVWRAVAGDAVGRSPGTRSSRGAGTSFGGVELQLHPAGVLQGARGELRNGRAPTILTLRF